MTCGKCRKYSRSKSRCLDGKCNPRTKRGVFEAAAIMGPGYICSHNKWKSQVCVSANPHSIS